MPETYQAFQWLYSTMSNDTALVAAATGGIWEGIADLGVVAPYASYNQQSSIDSNTMNAVRLFTDKLFQIKAVGPTKQYSALVTIAGRIDALFGNVRNVALAQGGVLACYRVQELASAENINGASWSHLGGLYRIELQGS